MRRRRGWQLRPEETVSLELFSKFTWVGSGRYMIDSMRTVGSEGPGEGAAKELSEGESEGMCQGQG